MNKLTLIIIAALLPVIGCVSPDRIAPGADPLVVQAEQLAREATDNIDAFIKFVDRNERVVGSDLKAARDLAATEGPVYIRELRKATKLYKGSRSPGEAGTLQSKIDALQSLLNMIREHYAPATPIPKAV